MILVFYLLVCMFAIFVIRVLFYIVAWILTAVSKFIASITGLKAEEVSTWVYTIFIIIFIILVILSEYVDL